MAKLTVGELNPDLVAMNAYNREEWMHQHESGNVERDVKPPVPVRVVDVPELRPRHRRGIIARLKHLWIRWILWWDYSGWKR